MVPANRLHIGPNGRTLVDRDGVPVLIQGDAAWSLLVALTQTEAEQYLADRRRKGFNAIIVNLIEHRFAPVPPRNRDGQAPFTTPGDLTAPNEAYYAHADRVIDAAAREGIQVFLSPAYLGYVGTDEGWYDEILDNGPARCRAYGRYVGARYAGANNIVWLMGGDRNPGAALEAVHEMALGIRERDAGHLMTAHVHPECAPADVYPGADWLQLHLTYSYKLVHDLLRRDYHRHPTAPYLLIESTYEGEHNASQVQIRRQAYWANLSGAAGQFMGNRPIWLFDPGWLAALDAPGSVGMTHLKALFESRPWHALEPDWGHTVVTGGLGEFHGLDLLAAARTGDGGTAIAYMPTARTVTVDMSRISGAQAVGWWFDPRTGQAQAAGACATGGLRQWTPPGSGDWVLVLDDASRALPPPGAPASQ